MTGNGAIDLIIRIKNGYMAKNDVIESPYTKFKEEILQKLVDTRYVKDYRVEGKLIKKFIIELIYEDGVPALTGVKLYSTPGKRWYVGAKKLKPVLGGLGISILSTPQGVLTNNEARKKSVGGELLFDLW